MEFIGFKHSQYGADAVFDGTSNHDKLLSNLFAQSLSLATGKHSDNLNQFFPGNRPNHMIIGANLDAYTLGNLLAYQECYVEFQGIMWDVNSFDQEGVQLGKVVANNIIDLYKEQRAGKTSGASDVAMAYIKEMDAIDKGGCSFNSGENTG
jgi:glucose-6-phosphate isomerase